MRFYLPTYEECLEICRRNESFNEKKEIVDGVEVSMFNYRLAQLKDFMEPIEGSPIKADELRGLTFVHTKNDPVRYLMLHKFFNVNQVEGYQFHELVNLEIKRIQDKADGSMIRFIPINSKIFAKTKNSFSNDQAKLAQSIYDESPKHQAFVKESLEQNKAAIFELTSPYNTIVLGYKETQLQLLQLRNEITGEYEDIYESELVKKHGILTAEKKEINTLASYMEQAKTLENIEGWVFTFANSQMSKLKTEWYFKLHGLATHDLVRENTILDLILNEKMDDALSIVPEQDVRRAYISDIHHALIKYLDQELKATLALKDKYTGDRKAFALAYLKDPHFSSAVRVVGKEGNVEEEVYEGLKKMTLKNTSGLMDAKTFVKDKLNVKIQNLAEQYDDE